GAWTRDEKAQHKQHAASGLVPPAARPTYTGPGTPYAGYCNASGQAVSNDGVTLMRPYYFPFVRRRHDVLEGFFDYRPRNHQEATVAATSTDWGVTWHFRGEALPLNPYCPADATDPDNHNALVNAISVAYGSSNANAADNGLGHPVVLSFGGVERLYTLNRADGHIDSDPLVVHTLNRSEHENPLQAVPQYGFVSPLASGGYPTLT